MPTSAGLACGTSAADRPVAVDRVNGDATRVVIGDEQVRAGNIAGDVDGARSKRRWRAMDVQGARGIDAKGRDAMFVSARGRRPSRRNSRRRCSTRRTETASDGDAHASCTKPGSITDDCLVSVGSLDITLKPMSSSPALA